LGRRFEGYILTSPPSLLYIPICNIFSHNNKRELFLLCSEIRLNRPNSVNNFRVCYFLFISFIIPLYLFNIICRVALLGFCFSGKITRFSQHIWGPICLFFRRCSSCPSHSYHLLVCIKWPFL